MTSSYDYCKSKDLERGAAASEAVPSKTMNPDEEALRRDFIAAMRSELGVTEHLAQRFLNDWERLIRERNRSAVETPARLPIKGSEDEKIMLAAIEWAIECSGHGSPAALAQTAYGAMVTRLWTVETLAAEKAPACQHTHYRTSFATGHEYCADCGASVEKPAEKTTGGCMACGGRGYIDEPGSPCDCRRVKKKCRQCESGINTMTDKNTGEKLHAQPGGTWTLCPSSPRTSPHE